MLNNTKHINTPRIKAYLLSLVVLLCASETIFAQVKKDSIFQDICYKSRPAFCTHRLYAGVYINNNTQPQRDVPTIFNTETESTHRFNKSPNIENNNWKKNIKQYLQNTIKDTFDIDVIGLTTWKMNRFVHFNVDADVNLRGQVESVTLSAVLSD